jgi:ankyrin repeat protein
MAAIRGYTNIVRLLIETPIHLGAGSTVPMVDRNIRDFDENTPLHYASEYGHFECIIYLVNEASADPFLKNKFGYTPSDIA